MPANSAAFKVPDFDVAPDSIRKVVDKTPHPFKVGPFTINDPSHGSGQLTGGAPGLQIRCGALTPSRVGSIPMHFRHFF